MDNNNQRGSSSSLCRGFITPLELAAEAPVLVSEEEALEAFIGRRRYTVEGAPDTTDVNAMVQSLVTMPAVVMSSIPSNSKEDNNNNDNQNQQQSTNILRRSRRYPRGLGALGSNNTGSVMPTIGTHRAWVDRELWSFFGSTTVEYLVLQELNTGKQHVAALAPRYVGLSVRQFDLHSDDNTENQAFSALGLGWQTAGKYRFFNYPVPYALLDNHINYYNATTPLTTNNNRSRLAENGSLDMSNQTAAVHDENNNSNQQNGTTTNKPLAAYRGSTTTTPATAATVVSFKDVAHAYASKVERFWSTKVWTSIQENAAWVAGNLRQDDFFHRTVAAGHKTVSRVPTTVHDTGAFMHKVYQLVAPLVVENNNNGQRQQQQQQHDQSKDE